MKFAPFLTSSALAAIAVILSLFAFIGGQTNNSMQSELLKKQTSIQELNNSVTLLNQEFNRQTEIINTGGQVAQKLGPPILRDMGYLAAKNKNEKLKTLLVRQKLEAFLPTDEQLKAIDKQIEENRGKGAGGSGPASGPKLTPPTP
jgi:hypothetical protein